MRGRILWLACVVFTTGTAAAGAQTPQPFPRPGDPPRPQPAAPAKPSSPPADATPPPAAAPVSATAQGGEPSEETLGMPVYPAAQYLTSYDAGRGQRYYLFGTNVDFAQIVGYYRTVLKNRGTLVYDQPAVHMFEVGRYRDDAVAFPPGVTIKDYSWNGSEGYLHVAAGVPASRFRTIIQLVPPPPGVTGR